MVKTKLQVIQDASFIEAFNLLIKLELPIKTSIQVSQIHKKIAEALLKFEESRRLLIEQHALRENGEIVANDDHTVKINPAVIEDYKHLYRKLLNEEIELPQLNMSEFESIKITPKQLTPILFLFV